jgi:hypothetical protein
MEVHVRVSCHWRRPAGALLSSISRSLWISDVASLRHTSEDSSRARRDWPKPAIHGRSKIRHQIALSSSMGSKVVGSSFSGFFTRFEIGHIRIGSEG